MSNPNAIDFGIDDVVKVEGIEFDVQATRRSDGTVRFDSIRLYLEAKELYRGIGPDLRIALSDDVLGEIAGHFTGEGWSL